MTPNGTDIRKEKNSVYYSFDFCEGYPSIMNGHGPRIFLLLAILYSAIAVGAATGVAAPRNPPKAKPTQPVFVYPEPIKDLGRNYKIRLIYFVPKNRKPARNYEKKITVMMTFVADLYRRDLTAKGYKTRGIDFEFVDGKLKVHLVRGDHDATFYSGAPKYDKNRLWNTVQVEIVKKMGYPTHRLCIVFTETHGQGPLRGRFPGENAESAPVVPYAGYALVSAWMLHDEIAGTTPEQQMRFMNDPTPIPNIKPGGKPRTRMDLSQAGCGVLAHELGHPMFLLHDQRDDRNVMYFGYRQLRNAFRNDADIRESVRFSEDHARMLAASRFLSEKFDEKDGTAPKVSFKLTKDPQPGDLKIHFAVETSDVGGLAAILYYESTLDSVVGGKAIRGRRFSSNESYDRRPLVAGQLLHWKVLVADTNGNVGSAVLGIRVPQEKGNKALPVDFQ